MEEQTKVCKVCEEEKSLEEFYSQKKHSKSRGEYLYYNPECKECTKGRSWGWQVDNRKRRSNLQMKYAKTPKGKEVVTRASRKYREDGKQKEWQRNNTDKVKTYNKNHSNHDITEQEWLECLDYFNYSCAYCSLSEQDQIEIYNQQLHREHVNHGGSDYIENCVPACTKCNTSKHDTDFNKWYTQENEVFSKRRLNKIINWMTKECFKVLNIE